MRRHIDLNHLAHSLTIITLIIEIGLQQFHAKVRNNAELAQTPASASANVSTCTNISK